MDLKKMVEEMLADDVENFSKKVEEEKMMNYFRSLLPEEVSKIHKTKARRTIRLMRR